MTTIAFDRRAGVMASDTQVTSCTRKFRAHKIHHLPDGSLWGATGSMSAGQKLRRWAERGFKPADKPEFDGAPEVECLLVRPNGSIWCVDGELEPLPFTDEFIAIGSGGPYAVAAMECGRTPEEAVHVAAKFDAATSEPVEVFKLGPKRGRAKIEAASVRPRPKTVRVAQR